MMYRSIHLSVRRSRGSVYILVLAVLSVLALLTLSLTYSAKVETMASRNWANTIQANMAAVTVIPLFNPGGQGLDPRVTPLRAMPSGTNNLQSIDEAQAVGPQSLVISLEPVRWDAAFTDEDADTMYAADALAEIEIHDASGKININAIAPLIQMADDDSVVPYPTYDLLARFIERTLEDKEIDGVDARQLAYAIAERRYGEDGRPGTAQVDDNANADVTQGDVDGLDNDQDWLIDESDEGLLGPLHDGLDNNRNGEIDEAGESLSDDGMDNNLDGQIDEEGDAVDEPEECSSDPRLPPRGDDRLYVSLGELLSVEGMTPEAFEALAPHLTIFSVSFTAFELPEQFQTGEQTLGWPQVDPNTASAKTILETLRKRFPDASETLLTQFTANLLDRRDADDEPTVLRAGSIDCWGQEMTPLLNEVCPDTASFDEDGDDGQYIEIYNPYTQTFDLSGWSIQGAGPTLYLFGSLPPDGLLVLTDDYADENDPTPEDEPGQGSFYDVFNMVSGGSTRRIEEYLDLDLPNEKGTVRLLNERGRVVDEFSYTNGYWTGAAKSFQRLDPRLRIGARTIATPLKPNIGAAFDTDGREALQVQEKWQNEPLLTALDVMLIGSAYVEDVGAGAENAQTHPWAMPVLETDRDDQLDVRLVDCFRIGVAPPVESMEPVSTEVALPDPPDCATVFGRLNLNTAPLRVLAALPGMDENILARLGALRQGVARARDMDWDNPASPLQEALWRNPSDFLRDDLVWGERSLYDRLDAVYGFFELLTTHSMAMEVTTANRTGQDDEDALETPTRRPSRRLGYRLLAGDRGGVETVDFRFTWSDGSLFGDPDLRYAGLANPADSETLSKLEWHAVAQRIAPSSR